jgi:DNA processing protein
MEPDAAMRAVLRALGHDPADVDTLAARTALSIAATVGALTALELDQKVAPLPGGLWQRLG